MSVRYNVYLNNGKHIAISYICFGLLNRFPWSHGQTYNLYRTREQRQIAEDELSSGNVRPENVHFLQYMPEDHFYTSAWSHEELKPTRNMVRFSNESGPEAKKRALKAYFGEMKLLLADMPIFSDMVTVHPLAKCVRVYTHGQPADKVMLAMFMFRNLAQEDYIHGYLELRSKGYRPRAAAILTHYLYYTPPSPFSGGTWTERCLEESSWINPRTFGKNAFINMLKQDMDIEWAQDLFNVQSNGYHRDHHFRNDDVVFDSNGDRYDEDSPYYRRMSDAFCLPSDEKFHTSQRWCSEMGWYWDSGLPNDPVETVFLPLINESGISVGL